MWTRQTSSSNGESLGIGERLRNAREARGYSLAAMERLTKVRADYLQALEEERFDRLPERIYARGFLRTYSLTLGIDPQELIEVYDRAFTAPLGPIIGDRAVEIPIQPAVRRSRLRRILGYVVTVLSLVAIYLVYVGVMEVREFSRPVPPPPPATTGPPRVSSPPPPPTPAPRPTVQAPPPASPAPPAAAGPSQAGGVRMDLKASGRSWLQVSADGKLLFEGFVLAGEIRSWTASKQLIVQVGFAPAVTMLVNGRPVELKSSDLVWKGTFTAGQ